MRQLVVVALMIMTAACAGNDPPAQQRIARRVNVLCPTDDQLKDMAIEASKATYRQAPGRSRTCACPEDIYVRSGEQVSCSAPGAIRPATWVMCRRRDVPSSLLATMKAKLQWR